MTVNKVLLGVTVDRATKEAVDKTAEKHEQYRNRSHLVEMILQKWFKENGIEG